MKNNSENELKLDENALKAVKTRLDEGAITPAYGPHRDAIVKLLNDSLATELVCVLRYKRHHFTATGVSSASIAEEFLVHANEEAAHADELKDWLQPKKNGHKSTSVVPLAGKFLNLHRFTQQIKRK